MNRVIKFRGKSKTGPLWVYGYYRYSPSWDQHIIDAPNGIYEVIGATVGQFTGLLDKNGKEIYEGDILLTGKDWDGDTGSVVIYNEVGIKDGCFGYIGEQSGDLLPFCHNEVTEEIAGNIHDNPELLKGELIL